MQAFPCTATSENNHQPGMNLRDYFAALAMQALISSQPHRDADTIANLAYMFSDRMLEER